MQPVKRLAGTDGYIASLVPRMTKHRRAKFATFAPCLAVFHKSFGREPSD